VSTKRIVLDRLDRLPENCTLDDVVYHLSVLRSIERGRSDADAGRTIPHEEVVRALRKKWPADAAG
jgi:predicted transcriptional regulator